MKRQQRLTRRESQQATRDRLIRAAEKAFIRSGFDASPVERIAEEAGFSRGAFYSNFRSKDELFIAVLDKKRREIAGALDEIVRREPDPAKRLQEARNWYVNQELVREWTILGTELTLRALRNRAARLRLAELQRQEMDNYSALVALHFSESGVPMTGRPEAIALALFAVMKGLAELSLLDTAGEAKGLFAECRDLVFKQVIAANGNESKRKENRTK